ncbi:peptidase [Flavobacterium sp.]|uniref:peptidase n=1 Tax=Flavobacterium sp. TaxID=239 RepID=UPI002622A0B6|nr:peptidase [Flavobacterium sp.]
MFKNRLLPNHLKQVAFMKKRLILINEETFEELFSIKLSLLNVFVAGTLGVIFLITMTTVLIAFTPLREYIPGYASTQLKKEATILALKTDSLTQALEKNEAYLKAIQKVLTGKLEHVTFNKDSILAQTQTTISPEALKASEAELDLRKEVAEEEKKGTNELVSHKKKK